MRRARHAFEICVQLWSVHSVRHRILEHGPWRGSNVGTNRSFIRHHSVRSFRCGALRCASTVFLCQSQKKSQNVLKMEVPRARQHVCADNAPRTSLINPPLDPPQARPRPRSTLETPRDARTSNANGIGNARLAHFAAKSYYSSLLPPARGGRAQIISNCRV